MLNENRSRRIEEMARQTLPQPRHVATIVISDVSRRGFVIWSDGSENVITQAEAETMQSRGDVPMVIHTVSDDCASGVVRVFRGEVT